MSNEVDHEVVYLADLWRQFCSGRWRAVDHGWNPQSFTLIVEPRVARLQPDEARAFEILQDLLLGTHPMTVAINHSIAPSTVTSLRSKALRALGITTRIVRPLPVILAVAAHAVEGKTVLTKANGRATGQGHSRRLGISIGRFDHAMLPRVVPRSRVVEGGSLLGGQALTPAEAEVVRLRVQGLAVREVASFRATATRTVALQWRLALGKLGVLTRAELLSKLIRAAT